MLSSHDDEQLTEATIRVHCFTQTQADVVIERIKKLDCWPADYELDPDPAELAPGQVLLRVGVSKGRPRSFAIDPDGIVYR